MRSVSLQRLAFAVLAFAMLPDQGLAQDYPNRPITIVVPLAPGGGLDFIARTIGHKLSERLGQPVLIENRPGGGTVVAAVSVAKAAPDGYTLLLVPGNTLTTNVTVYKKLPYDPRSDFAPVALTSDVAFALARATGTIRGTVSLAGVGPLGGVTVTVTGGDVAVTTTTVSQGGDIGTYLVEALPIPATYTISFTRPVGVSITFPGLRSRCTTPRS